MPAFELPRVDLPSWDTIDETITGIAKDAAYITIGMGVLAVQQVQVRRRDLGRAVSVRLDTVRQIVTR